jgi:UDP-N-acetylglucosamine 1-carboxyvinyltransferase
MNSLKIKGEITLSGNVTISGSKNSSLLILAASSMCHQKPTIPNLPDLLDVEHMTKAIDLLPDDEPLLSQEFMSSMRASICLLGPLLTKRRCFSVNKNIGGCRIGDRPIDLHLSGLRKLGARIEESKEMYHITSDGLKGEIVDMSGPFGSTVTGTANIIMAACLAKGKTKILNAAKEPEIIDLCDFLILSGARVKGHGTSTIDVEGVESLDGTDYYYIIPDRIEAGTFMIAAAITKGDVLISGCDPKHLVEPIKALVANGHKIECNDTQIHVSGSNDPVGINISTGAYPNFPTDLQAPISALACISRGKSTITETVFPDRFNHVEELKEFNADIQQKNRIVTICGKNLVGAEVFAKDLRTAACLMMAGLAAQGETTIFNSDILDRGYFNFAKKLISLKAIIST